MKCERCNDTGVILNEEELRALSIRKNETLEQFCERARSCAEYCDCSLGLKINFMHRMSEKAYVSQKEEN